MNVEHRRLQEKLLIKAMGQLEDLMERNGISSDGYHQEIFNDAMEGKLLLSVARERINKMIDRVNK